MTKKQHNMSFKIPKEDYDQYMSFPRCIDVTEDLRKSFRSILDNVIETKCFVCGHDLVLHNKEGCKTGECLCKEGIENNDTKIN